MDCPIRLSSFFLKSLEVEADELILKSEAGGQLTIANNVEVDDAQSEPDENDLVSLRCIVTTIVEGESNLSENEKQDSFRIKMVNVGIFVLPKDARQKMQEDETYNKNMNLRFINRMYPASREMLLSIFDKIHVVGFPLPYNVDNINEL